MNKAILLSFALFLGTAVFAQQKKGVRAGTATSAPKATKIVSHAGQCYADKNWKLVKFEKFGVEKDPADEMKSDMVRLNADGTFKIIIKGVEKNGTYTKSGSWLSLKPADGGEALPYKIESCEGGNMQADWRDGDTHNHYMYKAE